MLMPRRCWRRFVAVSLLLTSSWSSPVWALDTWFEEFKARADNATLYRFLYAMPKGGDLHNHLTGSVQSEWLWALALAAEEDGYTYYTKVRVEDCAYGTNEYGGRPYLLYFHTISHLEYGQLSECLRSEYAALRDLTPEQKTAWMDAFRLDKPQHLRRDVGSCARF